MKAIKNDAREAAQKAMHHIEVLINDLDAAYDKEEIDEAMQAILDDPLKVSFLAPDKFEILLCIKGPAVRITGFFNGRNRPTTAQLEYKTRQNPWWSTFSLAPPNKDTLLRYCSVYLINKQEIKKGV